MKICLCVYVSLRKVRRIHGYPNVTISPGSLACALDGFASQVDVLSLLGDRGPDFGLVLLVILELLFRVAFCMRRLANNAHHVSDQKQAKKNLSIIMLSSPRLMEIIALHVDCPPLWPNHRLKFGLVITGFIYHRTFPSAALSRFYQIQHFVCPQTRRLTVGHRKGVYSQALEESLWKTARELSLGQQSSECLARALRQERATRVESTLDAMAIVFERLNHLAKSLFGSSLCLYGSAATGFATKNSDVDVVLQLRGDRVDRMLREAKAWRSSPDGLDINCFAAKSFTGFAPAVSISKSFYFRNSFHALFSGWRLAMARPEGTDCVSGHLGRPQIRVGLSPASGLGRSVRAVSLRTHCKNCRGGSSHG